MRTRNIGSITFQKLFNKYKYPERILREVKNILSQKGNENFCPDPENIEDELRMTRDHGAEIISIFDERYPELLRECEDPPIIISYTGNIENISDKCIGFVGARNCSANGMTIAYKFANELANKNFTVVSGLAKGIDTASHKGALDADKYNDDSIPTVAVIGGGIDNIYPKENSELYRRIAKDGVIITEYPFGTSPKAENFPKRNRIISALSKGVFIVEATLKSGSLITARTATEQNREVMCIPGFPMDERAKGCNKLIKEGAHIITEVEDIINAINEQKEYEYLRQKQLMLEESDILEINYDRKDLKNEVKEESVEAGNILQFINHNPTSIDELISITGRSANSVNSEILEYEIEGTLIRHPGNRVSKIG